MMMSRNERSTSTTRTCKFESHLLSKLDIHIAYMYEFISLPSLGIHLQMYTLTSLQ